jgi:hypothetical protein
MRDKKSSTKEDRSWIGDSLLHPGLVAALLFVPFAFATSDIWVITRSTFILPLNADVFEFVSQVFGNHRIPLSRLLLQPSLVLFTLLPTILGALCFLLLTWVIPGSRFTRVLIAALASVAIARYSLPGQSPEVIFTMTAAVGLLGLMTQKVAPIIFWFAATFMVLLTYGYAPLRPLVFWAVMSLGVGHLLQFLFVERSQIHRSTRKNLLKKLSQSAGFILLMVWSLLNLTSAPFPIDFLGPSSWWWLSWVGVLMTVGVTFLFPWESRQWLVIATFFQGSLLFQTLTIPQFIVMAYLVLYFVAKKKLIDSSRWSNETKRLVWIPQVGGMLLISLVLAGYAVTRDRPRLFDPDWIRVLDALHSQTQASYFIAGPQMPFLAQFHPARFIFREDWLNENSEETWVSLMKSENIEGMIFDAQYVRQKWTQAIEGGQSAQEINKRIVSRLILYGGKELSTETLQLEALKELEASKVEPTDHFYLIRFR